MPVELLHPEEDRFFNFALELVKKAGRLVRDAFDQPSSNVQTKSSNTDLVTETDQAVEEMLIKGLAAEFPDHKFIGEESVSGGQKIEFTDAPTWIIDPIDGTTNFVHRIPMIAICVGLAIKKQLRAGIVYNPITNELFCAQVGRGAFKNGFPIKSSQTEAVRESVLLLQIGSIRTDKLVNSFIESFKTTMVKNDARGHRSFGSAAINMVYVAQGSVDAYAEYGIHAWDIAAATVIVREAGGFVIDPNGAELNVMGRKVLCAGTKKLAEELSGMLTHADFDPEEMRGRTALCVLVLLWVAAEGDGAQLYRFQGFQKYFPEELKQFYLNLTHSQLDILTQAYLDWMVEYTASGRIDVEKYEQWIKENDPDLYQQTEVLRRKLKERLNRLRPETKQILKAIDEEVLKIAKTKNTTEIIQSIQNIIHICRQAPRAVKKDFKRNYPNFSKLFSEPPFKKAMDMLVSKPASELTKTTHVLEVSLHMLELNLGYGTIAPTVNNGTTSPKHSCGVRLHAHGGNRVIPGEKHEGERKRRRNFYHIGRKN
ncbi:hypothetical protein QR680_013786 [Steinernema hermaphroditum]|uniref:inositol-phosphate phosphatase n=1 Tax=Steinernema hermaphroditum TaxID=289476 RepID=A0AA39M2U8_9BILA|nr:hypothetical protein QR680_013786 [Steinernema hermaphroditum]